MTNPRTEHDGLPGVHVNEVLGWAISLKFMVLLRACINTRRVLFYNYRIDGARFIAALDPIDSDTVYVHELLWPDGADQDRIIQQLARWVSAEKK